MTLFEQMAHKLQNGLIDVDLQGHWGNAEWKKRDVIKRAIHSLYISYEVHTLKYNEPLTAGLIKWAITDSQSECRQCGENLYHDFDGKTITLRVTGSRYRGKPDLPCEFKNGVPVQVTEIDVPTGELVFANFFREERKGRSEIWGEGPELIENQYGREFSISSDHGRINRAKHLAGNGVGYGQMGNMSVALYTKADKIIVGSLYPDESYDHLTDTEYTHPDYTAAKKQGYKRVEDSVSCDMWCWHCADKSLIPDNVEWVEPVEVKVKPGRYRITHFYSTMPDPLFVYSKLEKIS